MRELVILIFQPIYDTGLAGLGGVIALSVVLELIKRFFTGMANALTLMPSLLIPTVVGILACLFFVSSTDYKPSAEELAAGKKQGLVWGLVLAVFFYVFSNAVNNLAWGNLANASADQAAAFVGLWQADLLLISVATFLMGYILGKFSYKLRDSVRFRCDETIKISFWDTRDEKGQKICARRSPCLSTKPGVSMRYF